MTIVSGDPERIRNYLGDRLPAEERRGFEDRLLGEPDLVREVELSLRLREGLEQLRERGRIDEVPSRAPRRVWVWVAGAAAAAVVALVVWVFPATESASLLTASVPAGSASAGAHDSIVTRFTFIAARGFSSAPVLALPAHGVVELRVAPSIRSAGVYRITLDRLASASPSLRVGSVVGLAPAADGFVSCFADASRLQPGDYVLQIAASGESSAPDTFTFTLSANVSGASP